ncbi:MAG: FAD-dependent monooxygenase [Alphaproteobacteria bacterium]
MPEPAKSSLYFDYPHFPFVTPPELRGEAVRHGVAIVGGGPVGLACALELARFGVASVVIEDDDTVADGSRAVCVARRSMDILQQLGPGGGVAERFADKGLPWTGGRSFYRDQVVFELDMPHGPDERHGPMLNLQQCYMELYLAEAAAASGLVDIRWQSRVSAVAQDGAGATLTVDTPDGAYELIADYVVAADGARSAMRQLMGLRLNGTSYEGTYLIADIKMASTHPIERRAWFDPPSNPGSTVLMHKQPDDIWRVDYQILDDQDAEAEMREDRIRERIQTQLDMVGETVAWELDWYSLYKAHCLCLDDYRHGRVFFVGDAAHLVPIFGVRGLNSGFADANNLGWKLAWAVQGKGDDALLDSYSAERRAATLEIFRQAGKSTRFMTPPSRGYALMREAALELALDHDWPRPLIDPRQSAPYDYADSTLNSPGDDFAAGPAPGAPLANARQGQLGNRATFLLDHLGPDCTLLHFAGADPVPAETLAACLVDGPPCRALVVAATAQDMTGMTVLADATGKLAATYGAEPGTTYLARPDGHVAARWRQLDATQVRAALARLTGRSP